MVAYDLFDVAQEPQSLIGARVCEYIEALERRWLELQEKQIVRSAPHEFTCLD